MAQNNNVPPTIPLLPTQPGATPEPISLPAVFLLGANAVSYLLIEQPALATFSVAQLLTARSRLEHLHLATTAIKDDPRDMLHILGILLRD